MIDNSNMVTYVASKQHILKHHIPELRTHSLLYGFLGAYVSQLFYSLPNRRSEGSSATVKRQNVKRPKRTYAYTCDYNILYNVYIIHTYIYIYIYIYIHTYAYIYIYIYICFLPPPNKKPPPFPHYDLTSFGGVLIRGGNRRLGSHLLPPLINDPPPS